MPEHCKNYVQFENQSFVNSSHGITQEVPSRVYWELSDGRRTSEMNPKLLFPNEGGTYRMTVVAGMSNDQCLDTAFYTIHVPPLLDYNNEIHRSICGNGSYRFNEQVYTEPGVYVDSAKTYAGCDSITTLYLTKYTEFTTHLYDTICEGVGYDFDGRLLTESGVYVDTLLSADLCDSIVTLELVVNPSLSVTLDPISEICADDAEFKIQFTPSVAPSHYTIDFSASALAAGFVNQSNVYVDNTITVPLPAVCMPDFYSATLTFYDTVHYCGDVTLPISFAVLYPDTIIKQKFNNVWALINHQYNGGDT